MLDSLLLILADIFGMDLTKDLHYTIAQFMSIGLASWSTDIINQNNIIQQAFLIIVWLQIFVFYRKLCRIAFSVRYSFCSI